MDLSIKYSLRRSEYVLDFVYYATLRIGTTVGLYFSAERRSGYPYRQPGLRPALKAT